VRKTVSALICAVTTLCAAGSLEAKPTSHKTTRPAAHASSATPYLQCVTFARNFTGMQIFGDAWTWWEKATGKYDEGQAPKPGAVLVFKSQGKMKLGHVAVVSQIITDRYIQITHANWSPVNGRRGRVEENVNVLDVSEKGDWSKVKVWYGPLNDLGTTIYTTYGFIYQSGQNAAAQSAANQNATVQNAAIQTTAPAQSQRQQIALAATAQTPEVPVELKAALTPAATGAAVKPVAASAKVSGVAASALVAQLDANVDATKEASESIKTATKTSAKDKKASAKAKAVKTKATVKHSKSKRSKA
jgi:surface antigen